MSPKHYLFEVEVPVLYTDDLDSLREFKIEGDSESEFLLNCCGEPSIVRMRMEISGEKDSEIVEVWGSIRSAKLTEPSRGYSKGALTDDQLAEHGWKLMREGGCEWCQLHEQQEDAA